MSTSTSKEKKVYIPIKWGVSKRHTKIDATEVSITLQYHRNGSGEKDTAHMQFGFSTEELNCITIKNDVDHPFNRVAIARELSRGQQAALMSKINRKLVAYDSDPETSNTIGFFEKDHEIQECLWKYAKCEAKIMAMLAAPY